MPVKRAKKTRIVVLIVAILGILAVVAILILMTQPGTSYNEEAVSEEPEEETTTVENETVGVTVGESAAESEREYYVDYVDLAVLHSGDGVFDIHIRFPNGEDYVVVAGKAITAVTDEGFYVSLSDRENHMLSSAKTDREVYSGTQLYLARYNTESGEETKTDYPWNRFVLGAHGVDEAEATEIYARRVQLEENLVAFMNQTLGK